MSNFRAITTTALALLLTAEVNAQNWTRFRGDNGTGISDVTGIPAEWSESDELWRRDLPGEGHASPVIFGNTLFITSALEEGRKRFLFCIDAGTGEIRWQRDLGFNASHKHNKNSWASSTPVTDGKAVFVLFADEEEYNVSCWDYDGVRKWTRSLGAFSSQHGHGSSPIIYNGMLIVTNDQMGPSSVTAFHLETGQPVWQTEREFRRTSYSTPMILGGDNPETAQIICLSGALGISSLDPLNGEMKWHSGELPDRTVASPIIADGLVIATCGKGGRGTEMIGVDPAAVRKEDSDRIRLRINRSVPYVPTPVYFNGLLFLWQDIGVVSCMELPGGKEVNQVRIGGGFSGSPVCIDGRLFCISEAGVLHVVEASSDLNVLGRVDLGDPSHATPAVANGNLYLRTYHRLICVRGTQTTVNSASE